MSARSAQRTRWRRWRMGRDTAGGKDREGRMGGCETQIAESLSSCALEAGFFFFFFSSEREHPQPPWPLPLFRRRTGGSGRGRGRRRASGAQADKRGAE